MHTVLLLLVMAILVSAAAAGLSAAPWLPTKSKDRQHLLNALKVEKGQKVIDLGCGDGSMLFAFARKYPEGTYIGYDISLLPLTIAWIRKVVFASTYKNVHIRFGDLFRQKLSDADVIFVFLLSKSYPRLINRFKADLKDDAIVVVEAWPLPNIEPTKSIKEPELLTMYFYTGKSIRDVN